MNAQKHFATYQSSDLKDKAALDKCFELEESAWRNYFECYRKHFKTDLQFDDVFDQIEKAVKDFEKQK
ncbi:MAG: hypothetical protein ACOVLC_04735 [Flavobacterium sp.]